jgi:hypothetical protein
MDWSKARHALLLVGSLAIGVLAGWIGFWIFQLKVPPAVVTRVTLAETLVY